MQLPFITLLNKLQQEINWHIDAEMGLQSFTPKKTDRLRRGIGDSLKSSVMKRRINHNNVVAFVECSHRGLSDMTRGTKSGRATPRSAHESFDRTPGNQIKLDG